MKVVSMVKTLGILIGAIKQTKIEIPKNLEDTLSRIREGKRLFDNDGAIFRNDSHDLPKKPLGYYREYTHPTPNIGGRGVQRVIEGEGGEIYYSPDHYQTFIRIDGIKN